MKQASRTLTTSAKRNDRVYELDGIRGWAAITVVLYHLVWETFGHLFPYIKNPVTATFINGKFAVCIFFILSGESLSAGYFYGKGNIGVARTAVWRYFRLTIPILATAVIIWALYKSGFTYNQQAGEYVGRPDWLGAWFHFPMTIRKILQYSFLTCIIRPDLIRPSTPFFGQWGQNYLDRL